MAVLLGKIDIDRRYRLRWRFDFAKYAKPRLGIWDNAGGKQQEGFGTAAWCVNKDGLTRAAIEGEERGTFNIVTLAECDGWDFVNFAWRAATPAPMLMVKDLNSLDLIPHPIGLTLETRDWHHMIYVDGTRRQVPRTQHDKTIHLAGFGR